MRIVENEINPNYIPVKPVSVRSKDNPIILLTNTSRYVVGEVLAGKDKGKYCKFVKHTGIELEKDVIVVPRIDILCMVEMDEDDIIESYTDMKNAAGTEDWVTIQSTSGFNTELI